METDILTEKILGVLSDTNGKSTNQIKNEVKSNFYRVEYILNSILYPNKVDKLETKSETIWKLKETKK